jgi:hypothetical protein
LRGGDRQGVGAAGHAHDHGVALVEAIAGGLWGGVGAAEGDEREEEGEPMSSHGSPVLSMS